MVETLALLVAASMNAGTVLALASMGLLINERAGVLNLGAEGMMLIGAVLGFAVDVHTGSDVLAFVAAAAGGAALAAVFGALVVGLDSNQYATGLVISLFGAGLSTFIGIPYTKERLTERPHYEVAGLSHVPFFGNAFFKHHPLVYAVIALAIATGWFFQKSRPGLVVRAVGDSPHSAQALGLPVGAVRLAAVVAGGALAGIAGAYVSVAYTPLWVEGMVAGRGWIALALTTFAAWRPGRVLLGAYLFGGVTMIQLRLQAGGIQLPSQLLAMLPYLSTIVVLAAISRNSTRMRVSMPASLGKPFHPRA
ncbi:MAG TPA: ABC transporter permease [Polyangiaceae bacterium]